MHRTDHHGVTFLEIFNYRFSDRTNIIFPLQHTILHQIVFGIFIPNKTAKITKASVNLKTMTQAKQFTGFKIIWVHNHNHFGGFG